MVHALSVDVAVAIIMTWSELQVVVEITVCALESFVYLMVVVSSLELQLLG